MKPIDAPAVRVEALSAWRGVQRVLRDVELTCEPGSICALIGSGDAGKSTLLKAMNRLLEDLPGYRFTGHVWVDGDDLLDPAVPARVARQRIGMLLRRPAPFAMSIFENVAFGLRIKRSTYIEPVVEDVLRRVELWDDVEHRLGASPDQLSGGQLQRLCLARALAVGPQVLLLDDPTARTDRRETHVIERVIDSLRGRLTVILATQDVGQAGRLADTTAYMDRGRVVEVGTTDELFTNPREPATEAFLSRRYA